MILHVSDGSVIGAFSSVGFRKEKVGGKGFLMSVSNRKKFDIRKDKQQEIINYYTNKLVFGNDEFVVYYNMTFSIMFGSNFCYFETKGKDVNDFITVKDDTGRYVQA